MAKTRTPSRKRRPAPPSRRPPLRQAPKRNWLERNVLVVVLVSVVVLGGLALFLFGRSDDDQAATSGAGGRTGADFHSLVVDPTNPSRLFVGGHTAVSVSTDGGRTWTEVQSLQNADAMGWGFVGNTIYVSGHPGLNRSTDGGQTFERINQGLPNTDVHAFGSSSDALYGASPGAGVFASTTGAASWQVRTSDTGQAFFGRIIVDPQNSQHLLASDAQAGVAESTDAGRTWHTLQAGISAATWISASADLTVIAASGPAGASRSDDGGRTWKPLRLPAGATLVEVAPDASVLYAGIHRGERVEAMISRDGGEQWAAP